MAEQELAIVIRAIDNASAALTGVRGALTGLETAGGKANASLQGTAAGLGNVASGAKKAGQESTAAATATEMNWWAASRTLFAVAAGYALVASTARAALKPVLDGLKAIDDLNVSTASMAATIVSAQRGSADTLVQRYEQAKDYSRAMLEHTEQLDKYTVLTAKNLQDMVDQLAQGHILLQVNNTEHDKFLISLGNAIALKNKDLDISRQIRQETRALTDGQARLGSIVAMQLDQQVGGLDKFLERHKKAGDLIPALTRELAGYNVAAKDLENSLQGQQTTLTTIYTRVLRGGFGPAYDDIIAQAKELAAIYVDDNGNLTEQGKLLQRDIKTGWEIVKRQLHEISPIVLEILRALKEIAVLMAKIPWATVGAAYVGYRIGGPWGGAIGAVTGLGYSAAQDQEFHGRKPDTLDERMPGGAWTVYRKTAKPSYLAGLPQDILDALQHNATPGTPEAGAGGGKGGDKDKEEKEAAKRAERLRDAHARVLLEITRLEQGQYEADRQRARQELADIEREWGKRSQIALDAKKALGLKLTDINEKELEAETKAAKEAAEELAKTMGPGLWDTWFMGTVEVRQETQKQADEIAKSVRTPEEALKEQITLLTSLRDEGYLTEDVFQRAAKAAAEQVTDDLAATINAYEQVLSGMKEFGVFDLTKAREAIEQQKKLFIEAGVDIDLANEWAAQQYELRWEEAALRSGDFLEGMRAEIERTKRELPTLGTVGGQAIDVLGNAFDDAAERLAEFTKTGKLDIREFASDVLLQFTRLSMQLGTNALWGWLLQIGGAALGGAAGGSAAGGLPSGVELGQPTSLGTIYTHAGAIVGEDLVPSRQVPAWLLAGAPRYHSGRLPGLRPGERAAILEDGEAVLTRGQQRALGRRGDSYNYNVTIQALDSQSVEEWFERNPGVLARQYAEDDKVGGPMRSIRRRR